MLRAALILLLVFAAPARAAAPVTDVTLKLTVGPNDARSDITIRAPLAIAADARAVTRLRATPARFDETYRSALVDALQLGGVLNAGDASVFVDAMRALPDLRLHGGVAVLTASSNTTVPWGVHDRRGRTIAFEPRGVGAGTRVHLAFSLSRGTLEAVRPLPASEPGPRDVAWDFAAPQVPAVKLQVTPGVYGGGPDLPRELAGALAALLPFLIALFGLRRWCPGLGGLFAVALAAAAGQTSYTILVAIRTVGLDALRGALPLAALLALALITWRRPRRGDRLVARWALVVAGLAGFAVVSDLAVEGHSAPVLTAAAAVLSLVPLGVAVAAAGGWLFVAGGPLVTRALRRRSRWLGAALVGAMLAQQVLAAHAFSARLAPSGFAASGQGSRWAGLLAGQLRDLPFVLDVLVLNLLPVALLGVLAVRLWRGAGTGEPALGSPRASLALGLQFGIAVAGLGGTLYGYPAPVAFALAVTLVTLAVRRAAARHPALAGDATALLAQAAELATLAHQQSTLADTDADAATKRAALAERRRELLATRRESDVLAGGLYGGSGARERLRVAARTGWWIVAVPAAYGTYALIRDSGADAVAADRSLGLAFLAVGILIQLATWPVAAWCFIAAAPILPGRHGVVKAILATAAYVVAGALASWILGDARDGANWLFVAAELGLVYVATGLLLDYHAVRRAGLDLRELGLLYRLTSVRSLVVYAAPVAVLLFTVVHGLATGKGAAALGDLVTNASSLIPGGR